MSHLWKYSALALTAFALLLSGCNGNKEETAKPEQSEEVTISENRVYHAPDKPTAYMKTAYDELSGALEQGDRKAEAEALAKLFAADFFTLANKTSDSDVGGLNYIASNSYEDMAVYARFYYNNNYSMIVAEQGKDQLPSVSNITVESCESSDVSYNGTAYSGYQIRVKLEYADTKVSDLKTEATLSVALMDDYDYETLQQLNEGSLSEAQSKNLMRVIALA